MTARTAAPLVALLVGLGLVALLVAEPDAPAPPPPTTGPVATASEAPPRAPTSLEPAPARPSDPAPASGAGRALRGTVVDAASGAPIPAARVAARGLTSGGLTTGETDAAGAFAFPDAGPGALEVIAVAEGWLLPEPVQVAAGGGEVVVRLDAGVPVSGQVVTASGPPPGRVEVRLVGASPRFVGGFEPTFTDADGRFRVPGVPLESGLALVASAPGWSEARLDLPPVTGALEGLRLELRRLAVTGSVVAEGVARSEDLAVLVRPGDGPGDASRAPVGRDGRFQAPVPRPGDWLVRAEQPGAASAWERVRLTDGAGPPEVQLVLRPLTTITGRVLAPDGAPAPNAVVTAEPTRGGQARSTRADGEGAFSIPAAEGERYVVRAALPGHAPADQGVEAPATGVVLQLGLAARVEVTPFLGPGGRPLAGATLGCDPAGDGHTDEHHGEGTSAEPFEVPLDAEGRPQLDALPPGRWTLHLLEPIEGGVPGQELRGWVMEVEAKPGEPVRLSLDASAPRGQVRGVVRGAPGDDLVQVELRPIVAESPTEANEATETSGGAFQFVAACAAGPDGSFTFPAVPPGRYDVFAGWEGGEARGQVEVTAGAPAWVELAR